ncbi:MULTISPECIES: nucleoid-associated protein YejK [Vibrio]|uniref:Nucleoid-associated protein A1QO_11375 n=1 Tax=Vibrio genomosp. F10 str. ZF-129 TaxID=1187848 RepID=A0A1E5BCM6_9VIBR|nr:MULTISPECIES: nucleoid-associated protein YejK [Vibrio]OEE32441.1 nucleoid-associated protein YejK [Vibrio genomosp. F10 str. ZF-129]OEE96172.1 nucleoid-associated protein YejK [Vibrio genomosp. F10 str. 9ZD137]OEE97255.1 nucleoid-associated protein YejK [Vibrio genomosp. F10 str. 9ZC157]OEF04489.1 nucleoid-associated protein YejK [Vibrio genomosp. F10 str. 9ZB36]WGW01310.1 nucleoid-associated protein YejK [Vibrio sp. YMD68]
MSLQLSNVILHQLSKNDQDELIVNFRSHSLENDGSTEHLVAELHRVFNAKAGKGFGSFKSDSEFQMWLQELRQGEKNFYDFSQLSANRLKQELSKYPFADEGILVIAEYQSLATDYLFVALLPSIQSLKVTEGLEISATDYLDINKMDIVARIDLSSYETDKESNRYLAYIKGRVGRKVADFFLDFLQAEVGLDTKQQNQVLMQAVQDFCSDSKLEKEDATNYKKQVYDYCNETIKSGAEVQVRELSGELPQSQEGTSFLDYTKEQGYELEDSFPADRSTMRKLTKYVGAGGGLNVSFDSLLLGERIFYDPETDTLTIKGTPPNLRDQLTRN